MSTVYLSIGTPKTGTTAIQSFLRENEDYLNQQGYCFPNFTKELGLYGYKNRNGHFLVSGRKNKMQEEEARRTKGFQAVGELAQKYSNIVLSDEEIWKSGGKRKGFWKFVVEEFGKAGCEVKIIVYLRRQDLFIQSLWNQNVKSKSVRRTESFDECMENDLFRYFPLDYYEHLLKMNQYIDKENIIVRPYEEGQFAGTEHSIFSDFLHCIGLEMTEAYTKDSVRGNPGLQGNFLEIKRIINKVPQYREMEDFLVTPIRLANSCMSQEGLHASRSMFSSYEQQIEFLKKYEESNQKTAREFLNREDGRLFYDSVKPLPVWKLEQDQMYRDMILAATEVFCQQEQKIEALRTEIKEMQSSWVFRMLQKVSRIIR